MAQLISTAAIFALAIVAIRFFIAQNPYEKILSFYVIFTNIIILILANSIHNLDVMLDIIILLFLLKLVAVLFLLFNRKKI